MNQLHIYKEGTLKVCVLRIYLQHLLLNYFLYLLTLGFKQLKICPQYLINCYFIPTESLGMQKVFMLPEKGDQEL